MGRARIPLRNRHGDIVAYALVDEQDYLAVAEHRWHRDSQGYPARYHQRMHELIGERMGIGGLARNIDHRNGNPLDCRRSNLRPATQGQNVRNPRNRLRATNRSGVRGVWWSPERERWCAQGTRDGRKTDLGRFADLASAVAARQRWEAEEGDR